MFTKEELQKSPEYWLELIQNELFEQVSNYLEENNSNRTELAKKLKVSKGYISQILNGRFNFTLHKLIELSLAINKVPNLKLETIEDYNKSINNEKSKKEFVIVYNKSNGRPSLIHRRQGHKYVSYPKEAVLNEPKNFYKTSFILETTKSTKEPELADY